MAMNEELRSQVLFQIGAYITSDPPLFNRSALMVLAQRIREAGGSAEDLCSLLLPVLERGINSCFEDLP